MLHGKRASLPAEVATQATNPATNVQLVNSIVERVTNQAARSFKLLQASTDAINSKHANVQELREKVAALYAQRQARSEVHP